VIVGEKKSFYADLILMYGNFHKEKSFPPHATGVQVWNPN